MKVIRGSHSRWSLVGQFPRQWVHWSWKKKKMITGENNLSNSKWDISVFCFIVPCTNRSQSWSSDLIKAILAFWLLSALCGGAFICHKNREELRKCRKVWILNSSRAGTKIFCFLNPCHQRKKCIKRNVTKFGEETVCYV